MKAIETINKMLCFLLDEIKSLKSTHIEWIELKVSSQTVHFGKNGNVVVAKISGGSGLKNGWNYGENKLPERFRPSEYTYTRTTGNPMKGMEIRLYIDSEGNVKVYNYASSLNGNIDECFTYIV